MKTKILKIIISKQYNELGDEFLNESEVELEIWKNDTSVFIKVDDSQYEIPKEIIGGMFTDNPSIKVIDAESVGQVKYLD